MSLVPKPTRDRDCDLTTSRHRPLCPASWLIFALSRRVDSDDRNADRLRQKKFDEEDAKESKTDAATDRSHCMRVNWISVAEACRRAKRRCFVCHSHPSPTRRSSQNALVVLKWPEVRPRGYCAVIFALSLERIFHKCVLADLHRPQEHWNAYYQTRNASYNLSTFATVNNWRVVYRT